MVYTDSLVPSLLLALQNRTHFLQMASMSIDHPDTLQAFLAHAKRPALHIVNNQREHRLAEGHSSSDQCPDGNAILSPPATSTVMPDADSLAINTQTSLPVNRSIPPPKLKVVPLETSTKSFPLPSKNAVSCEDEATISPRVVSDAIYDWAQSLSGKSLDQSIWAPKRSLRHAASQLGSHSVSPRKTTPANLAGTGSLDVNLRMKNVSTQTELTSILHSKPKEIAAQDASPALMREEGFAKLHPNVDSKPSSSLDEPPPQPTPAKNTLKSVPLQDLCVESTAASGTKAPHLSSETDKSEVLSSIGIENQYSTGMPEVSQNDQSKRALGPPKECTQQSYTLPASFISKWIARGKATETLSQEFSNGKTDSLEQKSNAAERVMEEAEHQSKCTTMLSRGDAKEDGEIFPADSEPSTPQDKLEASPQAAQPLKFDPTAYRKANQPYTVEDRSDQLFFSGWGQQERRDQAAAQIRSVILKALPPNATPAFVTNVVFGGPLEYIHIGSEDSAVVRFLHASDCMSFYDETDNGLVYSKEKNGQEKVIWVVLGKDVDVIKGNLGRWITEGRTRCVKAIGVDNKFTLEQMKVLASERGRSLEDIEESKNEKGYHVATFRFTKINDAVAFRAALTRHDDWEQCNIVHSADPCALATAPRTLRGRLNQKLVSRT